MRSETYYKCELNHKSAFTCRRLATFKVNRHNSNALYFKERKTSTVDITGTSENKQSRPSNQTRVVQL